ncbi:MAG: PAS domain-containing protein, partial [Proteobacteria bacterium]|nr:PAS domain-containing protein [Pseudomonadota bacterium]
PPHADIELSKDRLLLKSRSEQELGLHQPINTLFISLAKNYSQHCIGVILSGTGNDGTAGIQSIKAEQGLVFAQDQASAKFGQMPEKAVASGFVDAILPPQEIAKRILDYCQGLETLPIPGDSRELNEKKNTLVDDSNFDKILAILKSSYRVDFKLYKQSTIKRRMLRRMLLRECKTLFEYLTLVEQDPLELQVLYDEMLINVTAFFRDPEVFASLKTSIFPNLIRSHASTEALRLWITGCSSGEEVYSLIICLLVTMESLKIHRPIQAFATDISDRAIDKARRGVYSMTQMQGLSEERIKLHFIKLDGDYQINKSIRELCVFAVQNVTTDPPFSRIDLLSCRNLMIYLSPALQKKILPTFHYALNHNGILLLGLSETVGELGANLFNCIDKKYRIFTKIEVKIKNVVPFSGDLTANRSKLESSSSLPLRQLDQNHELLREAEQIVLCKYSPSGVVIRDNFDIVSSLGDTSPYLVLPAGSASLNIFKMARDGLVPFIRQTLQKAKDTGLNASSNVLWRGLNAGDLALTIDVFHMKPSASGQLFYLVLFRQESPLQSSPQLFRPSHWIERMATSLFSSQDPKLIIANLKNELSTANKNLRVMEEQLQQTLEEHQLTSEELKAASEEILSSNEELQSSIEELETSKEELQSTVEELNTVNEELRNSNNELAVVNADLVNLLNSTNIAIIIVSRDLHIRRFTPASELLFHLIAADQGRPLSDINLHLTDVNLPLIIEQVIGDLRPRELEVQTQDERWFSLRVKPYRSLDDRIDGAVISFVDIDPIVRSRNFAQAIVNTAMEPLLILNKKFHVISANQSF